jgi:hypothetical protein
MIEAQFFLQNAHFALNLFTALVFFAAAWLYFDAWLGRKGLKESLKVLGLFFLCLSFVAHATQIEQTILATSSSNANIIANLAMIFRVAGYVILCAGLLVDPLQKRPDEPAPNASPARSDAGREKAKTAAGFLLPGGGANGILLLAAPILAAITGLLYLKRAT